MGARSGLFLIRSFNDLKGYRGLSNVMLAVRTGYFSTKGVCTFTLIGQYYVLGGLFSLSDLDALLFAGYSISNFMAFNYLKAIMNYWLVAA